MSHRLIIAILAVPVVLLIVVFVVLSATPYITTWLYVDPDRAAGQVIRLAQQTDASQIDRLVLHIERPVDGGKPITVVLTSKRDPVDVAKLLIALTRSWVVDKPVRTSYRSDAIKVDVRKGKSFALYGRFDPAAAPIVSGRLRSYDLGQIAQGIARRKAAKGENVK